MSLGETEDVIEARIEERERERERNQKDMAALVHTLGGLIITAFAGEKYPSLKETFPSLYEENEENFDKKESSNPAQEDWRILKKRFETSVKKRNKGG